MSPPKLHFPGIRKRLFKLLEILKSSESWKRVDLGEPPERLGNMPVKNVFTHENDCAYRPGSMEQRPNPQDFSANWPSVLPAYRPPHRSPIPDNDEL